MNSWLERLLLSLGALVVSGVGIASAAVPPSVELVGTIANPHPEEPRNFGWSLDAFGDNLLVSASGGSAYVIDPHTGAEVLRLEEPEPFGSFGRAITHFDNLIAVGANELNISPHVRVGSAYLFDGTTGALVRTLRNPHPSDFGWFGFSMESASGKLFISADSASTNEPGRVYVYGPSSEAPLALLTNPQASTAGAWGFGLNMTEWNGDLFVSAPGAYTGSQETGAVHRFDGTTLARELTILNPSPQPATLFGRSIATSATQLLVGAPGRSLGTSTNVGAAYLFDADTGALLQAFVNLEPRELAQFGDSVALVGNLAVIGAPGYWHGSTRPHTGALFVFDVNTGALVTKLVNPSRNAGEMFPVGDGRSLVALGGLFAAGSGFGDEQRGLVYLYSVPEPGSAGLLLLALAAVALRSRSRR